MKGAALARNLLPRDSYNPWLAADMTKSPFGGPLALVVLPIFAKGAAEKTLDHLAAVIITEPEHFWPIFMPGNNLTGRFATLESSSVMCPENPGSINPAVE